MITQPDLPYSESALEPHLSARSFSFHYGKHHKAYVDNLNKMIADSPDADKSLEDLITSSARKADRAGIFNNAAQVWNHTFYWNCMAPNGGGAPTGAVASRINDDFGSYEDFAEQFKQAGITQFGSGWAWLVEKDGKLEIRKTANADLPLAHGSKAILTVDVWEHAYYIDFQNRRPDYLTTFLESLVNWDFVNAQLG